MEYCFRLIRVRLNRPEEAEIALNQAGSQGFHAVGMKEFSNDLIVVMEKALEPVPYCGETPPIKLAEAKRGPGRPKKITEEANA